jgi:hypothetical protein
MLKTTSLASFTNPLQRIFQSIGMIEPLYAASTLDAQLALIDRRVLIPLDLDDLAILNMQQDTTATVAHATSALIYFAI